ncbi:MAG: fasciclin domain-containing protein [Flavobacteriales bacterium]|nr:fasciclin domain-containing protein [Flavobacteriales bacterium]
MKKTIVICMTLVGFITSANAQMMENTVMVGGEAMFPKKNIIENAVKSDSHTTLVAAVKAVGLVETLSSAGPFTVFAPVNDAFENLPSGTVETLLKPENKGTLTAVLTYHVIAGRHDFNSLSAEIKKGKGKAQLKTVQGGLLTFKMNGEKNITITDEAANLANISVYDVYQSNGVIHVIDRVVMPKM